MKLPDVNEQALEECMPFEVAILHCLRRIAVSLELLVISDLNKHDKNADTVKAAKVLAEHSVKEAPFETT